MKLRPIVKSFIKFTVYFTFFFFIQLINSDWNFISKYDIGKKTIFSLLTTVIFLLANHFIEKRIKQYERPNE